MDRTTTVRAISNLQTQRRTTTGYAPKDDRWVTPPHWSTSLANTTAGSHANESARPYTCSTVHSGEHSARVTLPPRWRTHARSSAGRHGGTRRARASWTRVYDTVIAMGTERGNAVMHFRWPHTTPPCGSCALLEAACNTTPLG